MDDREVRRRVYRWFADRGTAPPLSRITSWMGGEDDALAALQRLDDSHSLVLDEGGERIRMALPFSGVPTTHIVEEGDQRWWANCAWDALAIPATLGIDASIDAPWLDDGSPVELAIVDGGPSHSAGFVHFTIPARHWWDDIVET